MASKELQESLIGWYGEMNVVELWTLQNDKITSKDVSETNLDVHLFIRLNSVPITA